MENSSRTCAPRSATRATRLMASVRAATASVATEVCSLGSNWRNLGNSASSSRVVVRRPALTIPSSPSEPAPVPSESWTGASEAPSVLAASDRVRAGISTAVSMSGRAGVHSMWRTARRKRSVAASTTCEPSISTRIPVSIGKVSSRPAATATWPTASAKTSTLNSPVCCGTSGSWG
ncbi:Uncharacterised protein [Mycobacteroides abscessus subsp. abscessus]|nr:Uncharacterised protein [Mycobacteroides abscessus subsp. abscessus]